jgi:hypothetical protein
MIKHPIKINLKDFFLQGKFDFIKLGKTKEWILQNFPAPDDVSTGRQDIWRYGNIEFHFANNVLEFVLSDYVLELDAGTQISLDKWILQPTYTLTLKDIISELNKEQIPFAKIYTVQRQVKQEDNLLYGLPQTEIVIFGSQVRLSFILREETDETTSTYSQRCLNTSEDDFELIAFVWSKRNLSMVQNYLNR